jgi:hypothetical protein
MLLLTKNEKKIVGIEQKPGIMDGPMNPFPVSGGRYGALE